MFQSPATIAAFTAQAAAIPRSRECR